MCILCLFISQHVDCYGCDSSGCVSLVNGPVLCYIYMLKVVLTLSRPLPAVSVVTLAEIVTSLGDRMKQQIVVNDSESNVDDVVHLCHSYLTFYECVRNCCWYFDKFFYVL
jgi:hypothetical protein